VTPDFSGGFTTIGVLRFTSPRRAWVLDGRVQFGKSLFLRHDSTGTVQDSLDMSTVSVSLLAGRRFYRPLGQRAAGFVTVGAGGGLLWDRGPSNTNGFNWTVFGELGASYHPLSGLSLGVFANLDAAYGTSRTTFPGGSGFEERGFSLAWGFQPIVLTLYF
jgi:hypothetical protein